MRTAIRQLFRPEYGEHFTVQPTRWWSRQDRQNARMAAKIVDWHYENEPLDAPIFLRSRNSIIEDMRTRLRS